MNAQWWIRSASSGPAFGPDDYGSYAEIFIKERAKELYTHVGKIFDGWPDYEFGRQPAFKTYNVSPAVMI